MQICGVAFCPCVFELGQQFSGIVMYRDCGGLIVSYDVAVVVIYRKMKRVECGLISEQLYEVNSSLQVGTFLVGIYYGFVDIDQPVAKIVAQALPFVRYKI